eukprot:scaffold48_cov311-Pinguiococcus_pyrenoidosus.AAC.162
MKIAIPPSPVPSGCSFGGLPSSLSAQWSPAEGSAAGSTYTDFRQTSDKRAEHHPQAEGARLPDARQVLSQAGLHNSKELQVHRLVLPGAELPSERRAKRLIGPNMTRGSGIEGPSAMTHLLEVFRPLA